MAISPHLTRDRFPARDPASCAGVGRGHDDEPTTIQPDQAGLGASGTDTGLVVGKPSAHMPDSWRKRPRTARKTDSGT